MVMADHEKTHWVDISSEPDSLWNGGPVLQQKRTIRSIFADLLSWNTTTRGEFVLAWVSAFFAALLTDLLTLPEDVLAERSKWRRIS